MHVQVHHHDAAGFQVLPHALKEFHRGHLERDGDVLVGIHHDDVEELIARGEVGPAVLHRHLHGLGQAEVGMGDVRDLAVDLGALDGGAGEVAVAVAGVGAGAHAQDHDGAAGAVRAVHPRHAGGGQGVVIVHTGEGGALHLDGLDAEEDIGGEDGAVSVLLHLEVVVDGLILQGDVLLPEGEAVGGQGEAEAHDQEDGDDAGDGLLPFYHEIGDADGGQDPGEEQEGGRRAHRRDGDEGGQEGAEDAADGVEGVEPAHGLAGVVQVVHGEAGEGGGHRAEKDAGEGEDQEAGGQGRPDQEVLGDEGGEKQADAADEPAAHKGDQGDPDGGDDQAAVEPVRGLGLVRQLAAPDVADGHGDHDDADDDGPDDLGGAEVGGHQAAGPQLHRHDGHAGEELRQVEEPLAVNELAFHGRASLLG